MENTTQTQTMNQAQAVNVLIQAARIAQSKGAFTLDDAALVAQAIKIFVPNEESTDSDNGDASEETVAEDPGTVEQEG